MAVVDRREVAVDRQEVNRQGMDRLEVDRQEVDRREVDRQEVDRQEGEVEGHLLVHYRRYQVMVDCQEVKEVVDCRQVEDSRLHHPMNLKEPDQPMVNLPLLT